MLFSPHIIVGGVVGEAIGNPFLAFSAGLITHFILDTIPHFETIAKDKKSSETIFNFKQNLFLGLDIVFALYLVFSLLKINLSENINFSAGAFGGILPDLLDNIPFWKMAFRKTLFGKWFHQSHSATHRSTDPNPLVGLLTQFAVLAVFIEYFIHYLR